VDPFVEECRKEWKRLGVPDAAAAEMAADLSADLEEARTEGVAPEEVLGNGIFDPKEFARSWATERGLVAPNADAGTRHRSPVLAVAVVFAIVAAVGGGLVIGARGDHIRTQRVVAGPLVGPPFRQCMVTYFPKHPVGEVTPPGPGFPGQDLPPAACRALIHKREVLGGFGLQVRAIGSASSGVGWILFGVGLLGVAISGAIWLVGRSSWPRPRSRRGATVEGPATPM
jgi:hypothetical protein